MSRVVELQRFKKKNCRFRDNNNYAETRPLLPQTEERLRFICEHRDDSVRLVMEIRINAGSR